MLLDEFVDFRVRAGESGRQEVERERVRRADEHGRWLRGMREALHRAEARVGGGARVAEAAARSEAPLPVAVAEAPERELAHAGR
ncbi:hypothetical protein ACRAWB_08045 [Leifsonia poae]|uniref:hypothetical protein n=1 Tax=Leifsonia poae TaxID=110933 RepID=UPI003D68483D